MDSTDRRASTAPTLDQVLSLRSVAEGMAKDDVADLKDMRQFASWALSMSITASQEGHEEQYERDSPLGAAAYGWRIWR